MCRIVMPEDGSIVPDANPQIICGLRPAPDFFDYFFRNDMGCNVSALASIFFEVRKNQVLYPLSLVEIPDGTLICNIGKNTVNGDKLSLQDLLPSFLLRCNNKVANESNAHFISISGPETL